ncbi:MAG: Gfo/Idh/MocA family protein [Cyclobacteriaceae bacterium]
MKEIKWGIIGCGDVTEVKSGPAFNLVPGSSVVAVMRRDATKAEDYAKRHAIPKWYNDANRLIEDPEVNAIYVATPPDSHASYAIQTMRAGKPVYVEKPMARTGKECQEMLKVSQETGMPLLVAYYRRALPYFLKVKELVDERTIGELLSINITLLWPPKPEELAGNAGWRVNADISGGGHFHDLASHQFDLLDFIFGPIVKAQGISCNRAGLYTAADTVSASFMFENGLPGTGTWCFASPELAHQEQAIILGTKGRITFSFFEANPVVLSLPSGEVTFAIEHPKHVQAPLIENVVKSLQGFETCVSTSASAARASAILDSICGNEL